MGEGWAETTLALALAVKQSSTTGTELKRAVEARLATVILPGAGTINASADADRTVFTIKATNRTAADIRIIVPEGGEPLTVVAGRGTVFEIPSRGRRYSDLPALDELEAICRGVMTNGLEETITLVGDEVLRGSGSVRLPGAVNPTTVRWARLSLRPFAKKEKRSDRYDPW